MSNFIRYSVVSRQGVILSENALQRSPEQEGIVRSLLPKFQTDQYNNKKTFHYNAQYDFHTFCKDRLLFVALADHYVPMRIAYAFLDAISNQFVNTYRGRFEFAGPYGMREFGSTMMNEMNRFNDPRNDAVTSVMAKVDDVKGVMVQNIDQIMMNHEKVDNLVMNSSQLAMTSKQFNTNAGALKCEMLKQKWKMIAIILIILIIIIIIIAVSAS